MAKQCCLRENQVTSRGVVPDEDMGRESPSEEFLEREHPTEHQAHGQHGRKALGKANPQRTALDFEPDNRVRGLVFLRCC